MGELTQVVTKAQRRLWLIRTLRGLGWATLAGLVVAAAMLVADRVTALAVPAWAYAGLAVAVAVIVPVWAWLGRPGAHATAATLDDRLGLKDRLATALYAKQQAHPFAKQAVADGDRAAKQADLRQAMPIRIGHGWRYALGMVGVVAALAVFLEPGGSLLGGGQASAKQEKQKEQDSRETGNRIEQVQASVQRMQEGDQPRESERDLGELKKRLASLSQRDLTNPAAQKDAAAEMTRIRDRLDQIARDKEKQVQSMQSAMSRLNSEQSGPADDFENALRRGDYDAARQALERMQQRLENGDYSEKQQQKLQQQLDSLSKQLNEMAEQAKSKSEQASQQAEEQLQQQGLSQQQINELKQQGMNQQAVQQALQQQGMNQQQAKQAAKQASRKQQQAKQSGRTGKQCQGLGSSLGQMAQSLKQGQSSKQGASGQQGGQGSQFKQGAYSSQQQLKEMSGAKQSMQQAQRAQQQANQAMQRMAGSQQANQPQKQGGGAKQGGGGRGGLKAGTGEGGNPLGRQQQAMQTKSRAERDVRQGQGRVISSWQQRGPMAAGEADVQFDKTVKSAQDRAEQAVNEDRVPRRYHGTIKHYFNQLPQSAKQQPSDSPASQ